MTEWIHPAAILMVGALAIPFLPGAVKKAYMVVLTAAAFISTLYMAHGMHWTTSFLGNELVFGRVDKLSLVFSYVFTIMAFIGIIYAMHVKEDRQHMAALWYAGASLGVVFAGDYLTLFIFWEAMAFTSVYLVLARRTEKSSKAAFRYLLVHLSGGVTLMAGIIIYFVQTGTLAFGKMPVGPDGGGWAFYLIMIGFILNAGAPPLSAWLSDAYPEATVTGSVFLCAFTTKTAIYVLLRGFPGADALVYFGVIMALYGVIYAVLENDARRILAYHIISQVGFMVTGVGLGTDLALNGATTHAFAHILYKALLFMGVGAVLYMTGKSKLSDLGGLYKYMPITFFLYMVGAIAISGFPLFSGFVSKSMIISAAHHDHIAWVTLLLTLAGVGTFLSVGLKLPYYMFFGKKSELTEKPKDPPLNMIIAMSLAALLCFGIGVYPKALYNTLPFAGSYHPYTADHITGALGLLLFTGLMFFMLLKWLYPKPKENLDTDWFYRKGAKLFICFIKGPMTRFGDAFGRFVFDSVPWFFTWISKNPIAILQILADKTMSELPSGTSRSSELKAKMEQEKKIYPGDIITHWPIGSTVLWVTIFLLTCLLIYHI